MPYISRASGYDLAAHRRRVEDHAATVDALADWLRTYDEIDDDRPEDAELGAEDVEQEIYEAVTTVMPGDDDPARESFYDLLEIRKQLGNADSHGLDDTPIPAVVADERTPYDGVDEYAETVADLVDTYVEAEQQLQDEVMPLIDEVTGPIVVETADGSSGGRQRQGNVGFTMQTPGGGTTEVSFNVDDETGTSRSGGMESMQDAYDRRDGRTREPTDTVARERDGRGRVDTALDRIDARTAGAAAAGLAALGAAYLLRNRD